MNHAILKTLVTSYRYLLHNFYPPENRRAIVFYDRTTQWKAGGNGKSLLAQSFRHIKPWHFVDMKKENQGITASSCLGSPLTRRSLLSDTRKELDLESINNKITDEFTLEDKGVAKLVIPEERAPKTIITTNYTIDSTARSDRRRLWFVPIRTF